MKIEEIDKNFKVKTVAESEDCDYYDVRENPFVLSGGTYDDGYFVRVPRKLAQEISRGISILGNITAGMHVRFSTDSDFIELKVGYTQYFRTSTMSFVASSGFSLMEDTSDGQKFVQNYFPTEDDKTGFTIRKSTRGVKGVMRDYTLYFPIYNDLKSVHIGVRKGAKIGSGKPYKSEKPILWYGSSITQGCCVSRSDNAYSAIIAKRNNIDFINLGFSGNAKAESLMREYITTFDCSLFVCEYDYNSDIDELRTNHPKLYEEYRAKRPDVPILFVTRPDTDGNEADTAKRREIILETYEKALKSGDKNVYYVDGSTLFEGANREICTIDGCHPNDLGTYRIAEVLYNKLGEIDKKFN